MEIFLALGKSPSFCDAKGEECYLPGIHHSAVLGRQGEVGRLCPEAWLPKAAKLTHSLTQHSATQTQKPLKLSLPHQPQKDYGETSQTCCKIPIELSQMKEYL